MLPWIISHIWFYFISALRNLKFGSGYSCWCYICLFSTLFSEPALIQNALHLLLDSRNLEIDIHEEGKLIKQPRCIKVQQTPHGEVYHWGSIILYCQFQVHRSFRHIFFVHLNLQLAKIQARVSKSRHRFGLWKA